MLYFDEYWMGRHLTHADEWAEAVRLSAADLLLRVNKLLSTLDLFPVEVSSGWRPLAINSALSNSAKRSLHLTGRAVDLRDGSGKLGKTIFDNRQLLKKYGLWMEHLDHTKGWVHLDTGKRIDREDWIFRP